MVAAIAAAFLLWEDDEWGADHEDAFDMRDDDFVSAFPQQSLSCSGYATN